MSNEQLAIELESLFRDKGYEWKIGQELILPDASDIARVLDKAAETLYAEPDGATLLMTTGRLVIKKDAGHIDVYVLMGEWNGNEGKASS